MAKDLETAIIKTPYKKMSYTEEQIREIARCADPVSGPQYFMDNYFHIQHPVKGAIQYHPFDYQERLIDTYHNYRYSISLMPRQTGKSTSAAGYLLWYAMFIPDSTILVAAHKYLGAQEIMQRIRYAYENCPNFIRAGVTSYNKGSLDFENGSRIVSQTTTENTGRGMSISLLYCDEFAFVRPSIASEFWTAITPTLATGGKCIITSTPNSDEDQFALIWKQANKCVDEFGNETELGINGFKAFRSKWQEHPDRDDKWAQQMQAQLGEERFRREMECEFIIFDETLISPIHLVEMASLDPIEHQGQVRWYKKPTKDSTYVVALDPSLGTGGDYAALQVFELPSFTQVAEWQHNKTPIQRQVVILKEITQYLYDVLGTENSIYYSVENNTLGEAALVSISEIGEENIKGVFISEPGRAGHSRAYRKGFTTTNKSKLAACAKLKSYIETRKMHIASKNLISELKSFVASGTSFAAKPGETDDLVMATILVVRMIQFLKGFDSDLDEKLSDSAEDFIEPMPFIMI
jgi:Terminase large subunit, T4likevirus-type, N-terminal/Terminase RNaseH-like domain